MFSELCNLCKVSLEDLPIGKILTATECGADGTFLLHHHVSLFLRAGHNVCIVAFAQSFNHYNSVGTKLGLNLAASKESGKLEFIDGLKAIGDEILEHAKRTAEPNFPPREEASDPSSNSAIAMGDPILSGLFISSDICKGQRLKNLYLRCMSIMKRFEQSNNKPTLVIVDDISIPLIMGVPHMDLLYFLHYLRQLCHSGRCSVMSLIHLDKSADDDDANKLATAVKVQSDMVFDVEGLVTGYCADVHGLVRSLAE